MQKKNMKKSKKTKIRKPYGSRKHAVPVQKNKVQEDESDDYEGIEEMIDDEDMSFLQDSYSISNGVRKQGSKEITDDGLEETYEQNRREVKSVKRKLPIKTTQGKLVDVYEEEQEEDEGPDEKKYKVEETDHRDDEEEVEKVLTVAELLKNRDKLLEEKKISIGSLSAAILENPEEKIHNFRTILKIIDETATEVHVTVKKLAIVSLLEVFKDILPSYQLILQNIEGVKLKKDSLKLHKYEEQLLHYYKKYLQKLEKHCMILLRKKGKHENADDTQLALLTLKAMCDLLKTHPYFNYSENLAEAVIPFINHTIPAVRKLVNETCKTIFKEDRKGEVTLKILQVINKYLKKHLDVNPDLLEILLSLKLKGVNLEEEQQQRAKEKQLLKNKSRVLQLSKKEKKRKKKLAALDKELLETKAEENKQTRHKNITEQIKIVFGIYFKILKNPNNPKILRLCLEGLSKFASCISIEYYMDIINVLENLLKEDDLRYIDKQYCIQTVFAMLSNEGSALNIDPNRFYVHVYKDLLSIHAGRTHKSFPIVLEIFSNALIRRQKKISLKTKLGFLKRIAILALQVPHNSALASLGVMRSIQQGTKAVDVLTDMESNFGDGPYLAEVDNPEFSNASSSALYETILLGKSYHPTVAKYAKYIASSSSIDNHLPPELVLCTPSQLYEQYDMSQMGFKPSIPLPKKYNQEQGSKNKYVPSEFVDWCMKRVN